MSTVNTNKKRLFTFGALAMLFAVLWIFCAVELSADNRMIFIAESVFFLLIYALTLFNIPLIIPLVCLAAGSVGDAFLNHSVMPERELSIFFPVTYFLTFLFYIEQLYRVRKGEKSVLAGILAWVFRVFAVASLGADVYYIFDHGTKVSWRHAFGIFAFFVIGLIYFIIAFVSTDTAPDYSKKKKKKTFSEKGHTAMRISFMFVIVAAAASRMLFIFNWNDCYSYTVPVLWAVNLILLCESGHPLVCAFNEKIRGKVDSGADR